jgi:large subunit ribosomal protein L22
MAVVAKLNQVRVSPRKVRIVADSIKDLSVNEALAALSIMPKRGAYDLRKTLNSAIANAVNNARLSKDNLIVKRIDVLEGPVLKRYHPSTRGRIHPYKKRSSNIVVVLDEMVMKKEVEKKGEEKA